MTVRIKPEINFPCSPHVMDTATRAVRRTCGSPCHHTTMKPLLQFTKARWATNLATPAIPSESQVSLHPEPHAQITGFMERLRSGKKRPSGTDPSGQLDSQPPASNKTESVVNIIVDNLAQAAEICEKIANVVDKAPLIAPLAALLSTILKTCREIKNTLEHRNSLFVRIERIAADLHGTIMRMETTQYTDDFTGRLKADIEEYVGLFKKALALLSDFDAQGKLKTTVNHNDWESKLTALDRELDSFAGQFNTKRGTDLQIGQSVIHKKVDEVQVLACITKVLGPGSWRAPSSLNGEKIRDHYGLKENVIFCVCGRRYLELTRVVDSSTVIEKLLAPSNPDSAMAYAVGYFYFDFRNDETQLVETMLRSIIFQLSKQSPQPYATLDQQYASRKGVPPIYDNLRDVLDKLLVELGPTYIVLDALDECKETDRLIHFISTLQNRTTSPLHLLFTTACLLIELSRRKFDQSPDTILAELPSDLFEVYGRFLKGIYAANWLHIGRVLRWILFSGRPLTLIELEDTLAFDFHPHEHVFEPNKQGDYANRGCKLLEGLVTVDRAPSTESLEGLGTVEPPLVVTLAHASVADYLMSPAFTKQYNSTSALALRTHLLHRLA
ncbi:hypothetical protein B0H17DRAFT_1280185 [Mycena rosella]|uniref:Nephrocystin 3-like N-terminal domain-containing protein n=1 Tax=Mycena rosella TaxID=1033263 RepID=A0AAD7DLI2_MYCRO|nr:hypothetical protein B0H17DRAFT_1280185 [Mycena rosella]